MNTTQWRRLLKRTLAYIGVLLLVYILAALIFGMPWMEFSYLILAGWVYYLGNVIPQVHGNAEGVVHAALALTLAVGGLHIILSWWTRKSHNEGWRFGLTVKITIMILLLFAASIAATGLSHQVAWLLNMPKLIEMKGRGRMTRELSNLKQVGLAIRLYSMDYDGKFPDSLFQLVPDYLPDSGLLYSTVDEAEPPELITYFHGYSESDPEDVMILASPHPLNTRRAVIQRSISGSLIFESEFQEKLQKQPSPKPRG